MHFFFFTKKVVLKILRKEMKKRRAQKSSKMRDTVPGIIILPRTICATLDDLNGPEVTLFSLSQSPLCLRRLVPPRYQTVYDGSPRLQTCLWYSVTITRAVLSSAITISTLQTVSPAHVAHKFSKRVPSFVKKI